MLKKLQFTLFALFLVTGTAMAAFAAPPAAAAAEAILVDPALAEMFAADGKAITMDDFMALTPRKFREATGERLGFKKSIALKMAQKAMKKQMKKEGMDDLPAGSKNQLVAALLCFFLGGLGIHRFYLGYTGIGIAQIVLALTSFLIVPGVALLIWVLIDLVRILTGSLGPKDGSAYDPAL